MLTVSEMKNVDEPIKNHLIEYLLSVELGGTYSYHWALNFSLNSFIMLTVSEMKNVDEPIKNHLIEYLFPEETFSCCPFLFCITQ